MHTQRAAVIVCASLGALGTFLPWATIPLLGTVSGTYADGWFTLFLFVPAIALGLFGPKFLPLVGGRRIGAVVPSLLASAVAVWRIVDFRAAMQPPDDNPFATALATGFSVGAGLYLIALMGPVLLALSFLLARDESPSAPNDDVPPTPESQ